MAKKKRLPFNEWSKSRIAEGRKKCTSRHDRYNKDDRVKWITPKLPWGFIKEYFWMLEGAYSKKELQKVIEDIYNREVPDDEEFHVHFGDFTDEVD